MYHFTDDIIAKGVPLFSLRNFSNIFLITLPKIGNDRKAERGGEMKNTSKVHYLERAAVNRVPCLRVLGSSFLSTVRIADL